MIFGNRQDVALEISIEQVDDEWIFGSFLLWLGGHEVGNRNDSADLKGCMNWLSEFTRSLQDRCELKQMSRCNESVWKEIVTPVFPESDPENYDDHSHGSDLYSRFHLSHIGMSSFDAFTLILINDGVNTERYLWQHRNGPIQDHATKLGSLIGPATEAIEWFDSQQGLPGPLELSDS